MRHRLGRLGAAAAAATSTFTGSSSSSLAASLPSSLAATAAGRLGYNPAAAASSVRLFTSTSASTSTLSTISNRSTIIPKNHHHHHLRHHTTIIRPQLLLASSPTHTSSRAFSSSLLIPTTSAPRRTSPHPINNISNNIIINTTSTHIHQRHSMPLGSYVKSFFHTATPEEMAAVKNQVQKTIEDNSVVVFSKSYCPYCRQTKQLLKSLGVDFKLLELDQMSDGSAMQDALEDISGQRTVPNVYIKQEHIGGNSEVQALNRNGKLNPLLKEAGAVTA